MALNYTERKSGVGSGMAKTISFSAKCSDMFNATLREDDRHAQYNGYVPSFLGGGDYVQLKIDLETGQILNWKAPTEEDLAIFE